MKDSSKLIVTLKVSKEYHTHMPMFVEVTLANTTTSSEYYGIAYCDPLYPPYPVEFTFSSPSSKLTLPSSSMDREGVGFDLVPGESRTVVLDLAEQGRTIPVGTWHITAQLSTGQERHRSEPVKTEVTPCSSIDRTIVSRIKNLSPNEEELWSEFLMANPRAVSKSYLKGLSRTAHDEIAPYLLLHRMIYGPKSPATFPIDAIKKIARGPWKSEAALLVYECLKARGSKNLGAMRKPLLAKWPGLAFRVAEIEDGDGIIAELRAEYGRDALDFPEGKGPYNHDF